MSWTRKPLEEVAEFCLGKMLDENKNKGTLLPYLANINVRWGSFELDDLRQMRFEERELDRCGLRSGDIVMCEGGEPGRCAIWQDQIPGMMFQKALHRIRPHEIIDSRFLFYLFLKMGRNNEFSGLFTGATIKHLPKEKLAKTVVAFPEIEIQRKIADRLSAYDALIENNRRRIALLEQAARLLYEEWFVRFRFPGHERAKFINGLPVGWRPVELRQLCKDVRDHVNPEEVNAELAYIGLEHLPRRSVTLMDWGQADEVTSSKFRFLAGDILFGKIRPYFHKVGFALTDGITSSDAIVIRSAEERLFCYCLCLLSSDGFVAMASKTVKEGSKMPRADWKFLSGQRLPLPPDSLLGDFNSLISPITIQLKALAMQTKKAVEARDLLLPRLMSGEVQV